MDDNNIQRMKFLVSKLNQAAFAYYNLDEEIISDHEYDKLYDELLILEKKTSIILPDSPTLKVGSDSVSGLKKVTHQKKLLSLNKTKDIKKLSEFLGDKSGLLSYKLDGLTVVLNYKNGKLEQIITRGNGEVGEDITHNARAFKNIPDKIDFENNLIVRGEAVISYTDFEKINKKNFEAQKYKNPRNLCSGTVRNLKYKNIADRPVYFFAFEMCDVDNINFYNLKSNKFIWLKNLGFDIVKYKITNSEDIYNDVKEFKSKLKDLDFGADGLVLTFDDINYSKSLGATSKFPRDSIAFKWPDDTKTTELTDISWNVSRTGLITPVAIFKTIELEGTKINKATLHNINFVKNLKLGVGDKIKVYKANMIIPQIAENLTQSDTVEIPRECPVCNYKTEIINTDGGKFLMCKNPNCKAKIVMSLTHFVSRDAMNIAGMSEMIITKFVNHGFLKNYTDIYDLKKYEQEIKFYQVLDSKNPNKNHKLYSNLILAIENSKEVFLHNFIYALGINQIGLSSSKLLCEKFNYDIQKIKSASSNDLLSIKGFGQSIADSIIKYFSDAENIRLLDKILGVLKFKSINISDIRSNIKSDSDRKSNKKILDGLTFAITGDMINFRNRGEFKNLIESLGGRVVDSISRKTSALINNNPDSNSKKNLKALDLGVKIITEEDFLKTYDIRI